MGSTTTAPPRTRRPVSWLHAVEARDLVLALVIAVVEVVSVLASEAGDSRRTPALGLLLLAASNVPLIYRRRCPALVWAAVGLATAAYGWAPWTDPPVFAGGLVAVYSVGAYSSRRTGLLVAVPTAAAIVVSWVADPVQNDLNDLLTPILGFTGAWLVGAVVAGERHTSALLRDRAAQLEHDRDREAVRAAEAERLRIARELHDITAHHVAVIAVHAEAGQALLPDHVEQAAAAFETIADGARSTLDDLRRMLGVLRRSDGPAPLGPQPGIADLDDLVGQVRGTGIHIELVRSDDEVEGPPLPDALDLAVYRVVQEALTNVIKHAHASSVRVSVHRDAEGVVVQVVDDGVGFAGPTGTGGQGMAGMRERVEMFGGALVLPEPSGRRGFEVRATFPAPVGAR